MTADANMDVRQKAAKYVKAYMGSSNFDASHDWSHIERVLETSLSIAAVEGTRKPLNLDIIYLAALMHDITDHKYLDPGESSENKIKDTLESFGADASLAYTVQTVCESVSYSKEMRDPEAVLKVLEQQPELGVVQDADRLDAIGAVGIARVFAFTGAASARGKTRTLNNTIDHFHEKLENIHAHMKTKEGARRAEEGTARLRQFRTWFAEETASTF